MKTIYYFIYGMLESHRFFTTTILGTANQRAYEAGRKFAHKAKRFWNLFIVVASR